MYMATIKLSDLTPPAQARARLIHNNGGQPVARPTGKGYQVEAHPLTTVSRDKWLKVVFPDHPEREPTPADAEHHEAKPVMEPERAHPPPKTERGYHRKLAQIGAALDALHDQADAQRAELDRLEALGIIDASPYWRKNRAGEKTILTLTHSTHSERVLGGGSRSEYIGDKEAAPDKVQTALDALDRYKIHARLKRDLHDLEGRIQLEEGSISTILLRLKREQAELKL